MKIRLLITVFCFALIQFQGRAAVIISGNYFAPISSAGSNVPLHLIYTIATPSPDYILYFPFHGVPIVSLGTWGSSVRVNGVLAPFTRTDVNAAGIPGIYIKLQNPNQAIAGALITIDTFILLPPFAGLFSLGPIQTADNAGTIIDRTSGSAGSITVAPQIVTFLATTAITNNSFTLNWASSQGSDSYHLDISTSPSFTTFLTGYNNLNVGNVLTYNITGLSPNTTYYVRLTSYFQMFSSPPSSISVLTSNSTALPATVSLSNLAAMYDGSSHAVTATTIPAGLTVGITYNGSSTVPTNAGTYAIVATVTDPNYQGTASGNFVISKTTATVSLSSLTATYDASTHAVTATTSPSGLAVGLTYNGSSTIPTNAGTYAVVATIIDPNYQGTTSGNLVISKAIVNPVLGNLTQIYNGSTQVFTATTTPSGLNITKTYNGFSSIPTNAGTYVVVAIVSDPNYKGTTSGSLVISKATATVSLNNLTATYNGSTHAATATTVPSGLAVGLTYNGSSTVPTNAGTYAVVSTITDVNYQGTTSGSLVISKATATVSLNNLTATYNGSTHAAIATTVPSGLTVGITYDGLSTVPTSIGSYAVVATISDANYQGTASGSLEITSISTNVTGQLLNDVQLYPNPSKDVIWVRASVSVITKISVINLNGVTVFEKNNCTQLESLDISNLAKGVYIVCVDSEFSRGSYRVIVY